jgi:2-polyprenyl-3-methyl-5-hydroxy-6-metoxy-1,4-benzoquinol methylase
MTSVEQFQLAMPHEQQALNRLNARGMKVRKLLASLRNQTVLDVGCGPGALLWDITEQNEVHGVDLNGDQLEIALRNGFVDCRVCNLGVEVLPYSSEMFDVVLCGETLEHVMATEQLLAELHRVLKPGGQVIVTTPNVRTLQSIALLLFCNEPSPAAALPGSFHCRDFTTKSLMKAMEQAGFSRIELRGTSFWLWVPFRRFETGERLADYLPSWSSGIIATGRKRTEDYTP